MDNTEDPLDWTHCLSNELGAQVRMLAQMDHVELLGTMCKVLTEQLGMAFTYKVDMIAGEVENWLEMAQIYFAIGCSEQANKFVDQAIDVYEKWDTLIALTRPALAMQCKEFMDIQRARIK